MTIRMASIEVLDYRKDGEVEARRVTGEILRRDGRFSGDDGLPLSKRRRPTRPIAVGNALAYIACRDRRLRPMRSVHRLPAPSAEGNESPPMLDPLAELIRRYRRFNLLQPDRSQRAY
jgi:hypothetical protein